MTLPHLLVGPFAGFVEWLIRASLSATFIAGLVLLVQVLFGRWLSPAWRYRLWAVMVIRLLLPVLPASPASLSNLDLFGSVHRMFANHRAGDSAPHKPLRKSNVVSADAQPKITVTYGPIPHGAAPALESETKAATVSTHGWMAHLPAALLMFWLAGVAVLLGRMIVGIILLASRLRDGTVASDPALIERFGDCCRRAGVHRPPPLLITDAVRVPATAGIWRPRILLPVGLFEGLPLPAQRSVLLHELAHVKCRDVAGNWVLAVVQIVHWFNPTVRLAFSRLKADREIARDAMVLGWLATEQPVFNVEDYARTLLHLTESLSAGLRGPAMAAGLVGICTPAARFTSGSFGRGSALKRRLQMIRTSGHKAARSTLLGMLLAAALAGCTLTRAQDRPAPAPATNPAPATAQERQVGPPGNDEKLVAEARDLITSHRYDEALTILKEIRAENPRSSLLAEVVPKLLEQIEIEQKRADASREVVQKQLDRMVPELTFDAVGFSDVIDFLRDVSGAKIFVNWKSIEAANINRNAPITARLRNVRLSKALTIILDTAGGGHGKLGYTVEDGVIKISSIDDLPKNVKVYDVRDLLMVPPDFVPPRLGALEPVKVAAPATKSSVTTTREGLRDDPVKSLIRLIEETVAPDTWKDHGGNVGAIRELQGQLIVTQTQENQIAVMALMQQLRETRGLQCTVEARIISCPDSVASALLAKWQKVSVPATLPAEGAKQPGVSGAVGLFLDSAQVSQFLKAIENDPQATLTDAPRMTLFDGQRAYVQLSKSRRYTSGYSAVTAPSGQIRYDPVVSVVETGLLFDVQTTVSGDHKSVTVSLHPQISDLFGMKDIPWIGRPAGSNLMVQEPQVRSTELHTTVNIPDEMTLLIGGLEDPRLPPDAPAATQPGKPLRSLFLLVKPTIIAASELAPTRDRLLHPIHGAPAAP